MQQPLTGQASTQGQHCAQAIAQQAAQVRNQQLQAQVQALQQGQNQAQIQAIGAPSLTSRERRHARRQAVQQAAAAVQANTPVPGSLPGLTLASDPTMRNDPDPTGAIAAFNAAQAATRVQGVHPTQLNATPGTPLDMGDWSTNSAIQRVQLNEHAHFASLDNLLADMTDAVPSHIRNFVLNHFKFSESQLDLMAHLGFNTLESFLVYGALSVKDLIATVSRTYINDPHLAVVLFVTKALSVVFHDHAQEQQHNVLVVGRTDCLVDLSKLPIDNHGIAAFVSTIAGHKVRSAVQLLKRKNIGEEIKYKICNKISDPHLGSVVEVRSTSGYIRNLQHPDDVSGVTNSVTGRQRGAVAQGREPLRTHFRGDNSIIDVTSHLGSVPRSHAGHLHVNPYELTAAQTAALEFAKHARRRVPAEQKDEKRQAMPARYTWNGDMDGFEQFQNQVQGFYGQIGMGYMFKSEFQKRYLANGTQAFIFFLDEVASESQVKKDITALYGALMAACKVGVGSKILLQHEDTMDGLRAWMDMVDRYKNGGDRDVRIRQLEQVINKPYTDKYKGGLKKWVQDYENAFAHLVKLKCSKWMEDDSRKRQVLDNLFQEHSVEKHLWEEKMKGLNTDEVFNKLRTFSIRADASADDKATRKARLGQSSADASQSLDYDLLAQSVVKAMKAGSTGLTPPTPVEDDYDSQLEALCCKLSMVPADVWRKLPPDLQKLIIQERKKERETDPDSST